MATPIRQLRGTAAELATRVYAQGVITVDETNNDIRVHDGATPGGIPLRPAAFDFASRADAIAARIAAPVQHVRTGGYFSAGDGGAALYKRVASQPSHSAKFQSTDGAWWELAETVVNLLMVGCRCDGTTDDASAISAAFGFTKVLCVPAGRKVRLSSTLTIPQGCALEGAGNGWDIRLNGDTNWIGNAGNALILAPAATIRMETAAGIRNLLIRPPALTTNTVTRATANAWSGQAITIVGGHTDQIVENMTILGYNQAIGQDATGATQRHHMHRMLIDCRNGLSLRDSFDISYYSDIHCWPVCSVGISGGPAPADLCRDGISFRFTGAFDGLLLTRCFSYGYQRGFYLSGPDGATLTDCAYDYHFGQASQGHIALLIEGNTTTCKATNFKILTANKGIVVNTATAAQDTQIGLVPDLVNLTLSDMSIGNIEATAIHVQSGNVRVEGGLIHNPAANGNIPNGVLIDAGAGDITLADIAFAGVSQAINRASGHAKRFNDRAGHTFARVTTPYAGTPYVKRITAADPMPLDGENTLFEIAGNTTMGSALNVPAYAGRIVTLRFTGSPIVASGGNFFLGGDFQATPNDVLTLVGDGTRFYKVAAAAN